MSKEFKKCSGDPACCPENEGYGCCMPNTSGSHVKAMTAICDEHAQILRDGLHRFATDVERAEAMALVKLLSQPAAVEPATIQNDQWWLAELDRYGNPRLIDGAHSDKHGADKALYLLHGMNLSKADRYASVRIAFFEAVPSGIDVNQEAMRSCRAMVENAAPSPAVAEPAATVGKAETPLPPSIFIHGPQRDDEPWRRNEHPFSEDQLYWMRTGWNAYRNTLLAQQPAASDVRGGALKELIKVRDWVKKREGQLEKLKDTGQSHTMIEKHETLDMLNWAIENALQSAPAVQADEGSKP